MSDRLYVPPHIDDTTPDGLLFRQNRRAFTNIRHLRGGEVKVGRHIAVFVDGECKDQGSSHACGGMGVYFGENSRHNISRPLRHGPQTKQRAELDAAILALRRIRKLLDKDELKTHLVAVASDSTYLVNGITELVYRWQDNGWKNARGSEIANREDFEELDSLIDELEDDYGTFVKFWKVDREDNEDADELARDAAGYNDSDSD